MSFEKKILHHTIIQLLGKALGIFFSLFTVGIITRYLGQTGFGYYTTIFAFLQVFGILVDFGLQTSTIHLISRNDVNESDMLSNILTLRLVSSIIFLGIAPFFALFFPYPSEIKIGIAISAFTFLFFSLSAVLNGLFQKHLKTQYAAIADLVGKFLLFILVFASFSLHLGLKSILIANVIASIVHFIILIFFTKKFTKLKLSWNKNIIIMIINSTFPIAITIALNLIYFKSDIIFLSLFQSQRDVGLYGAPYKVLEVFINVVYLFLGLLLPSMSLAFMTKDKKKLQSITQYGFDIISLFSCPLLLGTLFLGRPVMELVAGKEFAVSGDILKILMFATISIFYASLFGYVIIAMEKQKTMIPYYAINAILTLAGYVIFIPRYSYWAASYLTVFSEVFILVTSSFFVFKYTKFMLRYNMFLKSLIASIVMSLFLLYIRTPHVLLTIAGASLVYGLCLFALKPFGQKELSRSLYQ